MYVVAITSWARPLDEEVADLARLLGMIAYDARLLLAGPLPVVFARVPEAETARELTSALRARGHGVVSCDLDSVKSSDDMRAPKSYAFEPEAFVVRHSAWGEQRIPYAEIVALLPARSVAVEETTTTDKEKKFNLRRAVATGGLVMRKTHTQERRATTETREPVLYVVHTQGLDSLLLRSSYLHHQGLGEHVKPTSMENFRTLTAMLRQRAPAALYDDRLMSQRRRAAFTGSTGAGAASSNTSENDLVVHLLVAVHLAG